MATQDALRMTAAELHARLQSGEAIVVLDVRTEDALRLHPYQIPGAQWIPLPLIAQEAHTLPRGQTLVTYCT
ncbi:MAG: hypothetical protein NZ578_07815 [Candidatus Binatia bacterium]|nr:hypothetical protein [Candidatus Binatia bacterium]